MPVTYLKYHEAQLNGIQEVCGSTPPGSTNKCHR
jgi:hypothetical protein